jgi:uncharacterized protein YbaR (Trm112 family)
MIKKTMLKILILTGWLLFMPFLLEQAYAQSDDPFAVPEFKKVELSEAAEFERRFRNTQWTGQGFQGRTAIDFLPAMELRARLQKVFGNPTKRLEDLITRPGFRLGEAIQYEYWFVINDSIPLMILDIDGPFTTGLVYAGPVAYMDFMPEIKRALSSKIMKAERLAEFTDVFYSPERNQWYEITYQNGEFETREISRPARFRNINLN